MLPRPMVRNDNDRDRLSRKSKQPKDSRWEAAEEKVSRLLTELLVDGYLILNNIPFPYGNLDHLVIRADGTVFLLETKSHLDKVTWDGKHLLINGRPFSSNPICQINRSIPWVRKIMKKLFRRNPWIVSILVFPNAKVAVGRSVKRVNVMTSNDLLSFIRDYPTSARIRNKPSGLNAR
jgi:hypothetical protein